MMIKTNQLFKNFMKCGLAGWCLEILFTALGALQRRDMKLTGQTSLWMFPIYGGACFLAPLFRVLKKTPFYVRGTIYSLCIFLGEFISGNLLSKHKLCPWSYENSRWNIKKVIRLDYFPNWFITGLLYEKLLSQKAV